MKYSKGFTVRKTKDFDKGIHNTYIIEATKEDKPLHSLLRDGGDYLIRKDWDELSNTIVKNAHLEFAFEDDICVS